MADKGEGKRRTANLGARHFRDQPLAELCVEDALKSGAERSAKLKDSEFVDTSLRFCIHGLRDWLTVFVENNPSTSLHSFIRDASWHWASFCEADDMLVTLVKEYCALRRAITENTAYPDLLDKMRETPDIMRFGRVRGWPFRVAIPREPYGVINETSTVLSLSFSKFYQVGLAWSLSTNKAGLYGPWVSGFVKPLMDNVMLIAEAKIKILQETRVVLEFLMKNPR